MLTLSKKEKYDFSKKVLTQKQTPWYDEITANEHHTKTKRKGRDKMEFKTGDIVEIRSLELTGEVTKTTTTDIIYIVDRHGDQYKIFTSLYDVEPLIKQQTATAEVKDLIKKASKWHDVSIDAHIDIEYYNGCGIVVDLYIDDELDEELFSGTFDEYREYRKKLNAMFKRLGSEYKLPVIK